MQETSGEREILDSWKEIASFLRRGVRTVQRWERTEGLPVRRHQHIKRGSVYAVQGEIVTWLARRRGGMSSQKSPIPHCDKLQDLARRQAELVGQMKVLIAQSVRICSRIHETAARRPDPVYVPVLGVPIASKALCGGAGPDAP